MEKRRNTVKISKHSGIYTLNTEQVLNVPLEQAWTFFSSPANLQKITPSYMGFNITSILDKAVYPGQIITYKIALLPGVKSSWVTEITQVKPHKFFIDEQRFGPYSMWHHEHWFEPINDEKTLIKDKISYKIPLGLVGHLAQSLFIRKQLVSIFDYRFTTLEHLFNEN